MGNPPVITMFHCSHLRPVVRMEDGWYHISELTGKVTSQCIAGIFREPATLPENWGGVSSHYTEPTP